MSTPSHLGYGAQKLGDLGLNFHRHALPEVCRNWSGGEHPHREARPVEGQEEVVLRLEGLHLDHLCKFPSKHFGRKGGPDG